MPLTTLRQIKPANDLPFPFTIQDITDTLPKNPNGDWLNMLTRRKDGTLQRGPRPKEDIHSISVHHSGVEGGTPQGHARYHVSKGYGGIAYHVYCKVNQTFQCNDLFALTWHTQSNNHHTIGICVEGDFTKRTLTDVERRNLYGAIITVMKLFDIPIERVKGHREYYGGTSCPGFDMNRVRKDIANILLEMELAKSADAETAQIVNHVTRVNALYRVYQEGGQYSQAARDKLRTGAILYSQYELDSPDKAGKIL